jgi:NAD(P)-dependent dehydrogenase (short-subunit alcohol dehydrogenase family)
MSDFKLKDKVAIVTGASRGIGEAIARSLAEHGASVVICSRKQDSLEPVAASIRKAGGTAMPIACHTGQMAAIDALYEQVKKEFGRVDILVNNAATNPYFGPMVDIDESRYDKTFEVNVKGYFFMAQRAAKMMVDQGSGSIINIASIAGISPPPMQGVYGITKSAVIAMTKAFAKELAGVNVRSNAICPGLVETKFASVLIETPELYEHFKAHTPMGRHAQPSEMTGAVLYFASELSSYTTGAVLVCDGGYVT